MFSRGNPRADEIEIKIKREREREIRRQEADDNDYSGFSTKGVEPRVSIFLFDENGQATFSPSRILPGRGDFYPIVRGGGGGQERPCGTFFPSPRVRVNSAGHGENGVLPTINSLLPPRFVPSWSPGPKDVEGQGGEEGGGNEEGSVRKRRRDKNEMGRREKGARGISSRACISSPLEAPRNLLSPLQYFSFRFCGLPGTRADGRTDACR